MKNNKKKLTIIVISIIAALSILTSSTIVYCALDSTSDETKDVYLARQNTLSEEELIDKKEAEEFNKFEQELQKTNLTTYAIMRKYGKTNVTETIVDKRTDLDLIWVMCDMIENNKFSTDELNVIKKYIDDRYNGINISDGINPVYDDEEKLMHKIDKIFDPRGKYHNNSNR